MRFHGLMLLRDEADIIAQTLDHLLEWIDGVYVLDLGSTDGTWEIVQDYARRDRRVVPFERGPILYDDGLRSYLFHHLRDRFDPGDWVLRIDADEFYHVPPPQFVRDRLRPYEGAVHLQWYFFRLTQQEVADYETGRVDVIADRQRPIQDRRRFYKRSWHAEPRMFRYRRSMRWPVGASFPANAGVVARERLPICHYPHRDPLQMQARYDLRADQMRLRNSDSASHCHWKLDDWRAELVDETGASKSQQASQGLAGEQGIDTGPLLYLPPGEELVERPLYNHLAPAPKRLLRRLAYATALPLLDRLRPEYDPAFKPTYLPSG